MARPLAFDRDAVLEAAVKVFWRKGFVATTLQDIKSVTGIKESSLYNSFGSKEDLYKEALATYRQRVLDQFAAMDNTTMPRATLEMLLLGTAQLAATEEGAAGCMLLNSAMELGAERPEFAEYARSTYAAIEDWLQETVINGQKLGQISTSQEPRALARYLRYNIQSFFTIARTAPDSAFMEDVARTVISVL